mgnify:CR=1 FL=1
MEGHERRGYYSFKKLLLLCATLLLYSCSRQPIYPSPEIIDKYASVEVSHLKEKVPQFFSYNYKGKNINFFVIKINGRVSAFLDACKTCYSKRLGFKLEEGFIFCRACNVSYPVEEIEKGIGGCMPIKIPGEERDGRYLISLEVLQKGADKF